MIATTTSHSIRTTYFHSTIGQPTHGDLLVDALQAQFTTLR